MFQMAHTHKEFRRGVAAGTAKIDFHGNWKQRLENEVLKKSVFNLLSWEKKVLEILAQPENKQKFEGYHRAGIDVCI